jgi:hypothetical protein
MWEKKFNYDIYFININTLGAKTIFFNHVMNLLKLKIIVYIHE